MEKYTKMKKSFKSWKTSNNEKKINYFNKYFPIK